MSDTNTIEFPELGLGPWDINRVAFSIFGLDVYWYGVIIAIGLFLSVASGLWYCKKCGVKADDIIDAVLICVIPAFIGARVFYVVFSLDKYVVNGRFSWADAIDTRDGGLAIYGGIIVAFAVGWLVCRRKKIDVFAVFDVAAVCFPIGQCIGRWGNFVNAEAHGGQTSLPWGMMINGQGPYHPTFLYESIWSLLGFVMLLLYGRYIKKNSGEQFFAYFAWYGIGRAFIEGLRTDSLYVPGTSLRISQILGIVFAVVSIVCVILLRLGRLEKVKAAINGAKSRKRRPQPAAVQAAAGTSSEDSKPQSEYKPLFSDITEKSAKDVIINPIQPDGAPEAQTAPEADNGGAQTDDESTERSDADGSDNIG